MVVGKLLIPVESHGGEVDRTTAVEGILSGDSHNCNPSAVVP